jgi:hypothetical protein
MPIFPALTASSDGADVTVKDTRRFADIHEWGYYNSITMRQKLRPPK